MISIFKTATELDRLKELQSTAVNCYSQAIHSAEQNVIELDTGQAAHFRLQLLALRDQLRADAGPSDLKAVQASFDMELKEYHEKTQDLVQRLRSEVEAAAAAVESFAGSITESESNLESGLKRELTNLNQMAASDDIQEIRGAIHASTAKIADRIDQMRSSNHLAIAQLKDEIRLLHQEVQTARRPPTPDASPESQQSNGCAEVLGPESFIGLEKLIKKDTPFSVLLVVLRNFEGLENCYSSDIIARALRGFQTRFENILPSSAIVERCAKNQFAAILNIAPGGAMGMTGDVVRKLSDPFVEQEQGATHSIAFNPRAGVIDYNTGSDRAKFLAGLKQLAGVLAN